MSVPEFPSARSPGQRAARPDNVPPPRWLERREADREALAERARGGTRAPPSRETVGRFVGLAVPIDFSDRPASIGAAEVDAFCNDAGFAGFGNQGSVADYFLDASSGKLDYRTVVLPYFRAPEPFSFYDDAATPWAERAQALITAALRHHVAAGSIDFRALTADAQQAVYAVNVLHSGPQAKVWAKGMWPHASRLPAPIRLAPGRIAMDYQLCAMGEALTLGVYCHENGHMLCGFPDLYDAATSQRGVGRYCLMCQGCNVAPRNPTLVGAYLRWRAGWGEAIVATTGEHRLPPSAQNRFIVHRRSETEYLLLENRRNTGRDAALHSAGLAVWHVDELGSNYEPAKARPGHQHAECRLLQADGLAELDEGLDDGDGGDLFAPGSGALFDPAGGRPARWWDGQDTGLRIHAVREEGDALVLRVEVV